mgnify:CR=1 FL=1
MISSIIYVYLGIVMIIVLATTFYVRTIKAKLDTKVDAMFQLVQSLVAEVNQLKTIQTIPSNPKEVIELDINSSRNDNTYSEASDSEVSDGETSDSETSDSEADQEENDGSEGAINPEEGDEDEDNNSPHEVNTQKTISIEPVIVEVEPTLVEVEPLEFDQPPSISEESKKVVIDSVEQNYDTFTVKELKELVSAKGGKITGKKKGELIEFLLS